jgi:hypothetical protein
MAKAKQKDPAERFFVIHLAVFVVAVLVCAAINLWFAPQTRWFIWVLLGWGIAIATHGFGLYLRTTRRRERIFVDRKTRAFAVHAFAYVAVILLLLFVNLTVTPNVWWFYWVALGWGAGLAFHAWCVFGKRRRSIQQLHAAPSKDMTSTKAEKPKSKPRRKKS